ncbi:DUF58 domain-containing protein [Halorientalis regularis]|uniref:Uncharacterized conserved protein, DUF58 family, contains vWF domain n=1 Tax=Halorientalis regularis TaxID=660518 RepID=A0A1G7T2J9_9EURY|nr:DUF58 domain-containing protein [Halorientalis regularis]SDG29264.1 Uncharacterized conserved protein, DUF58 family, contains vWF domain [Halorientalis regularis]
MEVTRRFWTVAGVGAILAALAVVFARPVLLYGAVGIAALLVARQYRFYRSLAATDAALTVEQSLPTQTVARNEDVPVTLAAKLNVPSRVDLTVELSLPLVASGSTSSDRRLELPAGEEAVSTTVPVTWSIVGRATFDPATVTATDPDGLFRERLSRGSTPTITVEPRTPRSVHVGEGGDRVTAAYGGHRSDQVGSGTDPAELRQYAPGDSVSDIDWKATARLDYPHVREYEVETDHRTLLVVDHRSPMGTGPPGETKLDYLRTVALAVVDNAAQVNDPVGLATVDDGGTTGWESPETSPEAYDTVRDRLHELRVTRDRREHPTVSDGGASSGGQSPAAARRKEARLSGDDSAYGQTLRSFYADAESYVQRMNDDPLFETVRTRSKRISGATWTLLFTDDTDRTQLRETVKFARKESAGVLVFLAPDALFERTSLADLERTYDEYVEFEEFRRELSGLEGVTAFEVSPVDRIEAVLDAGRRR